MAGLLLALAHAKPNDMNSIRRNLPWPILVGRIFTNSLAQLVDDTLSDVIFEAYYGMSPTAGIVFEASVESAFAVGMIAAFICTVATVLAAATILGEDL